MGLARALPVALLSLGILLVVVAVATESARLYLVVFIPVVAGSSGWLVGGIACFFVGFLTLPLLWSEPTPAVPSGPARPAGARATDRSGGLVLLGPVPIFFGAWRHPSTRLYWLAVAVGAALFVGLLVALLFFVA
jgi:uncharacterized membrane protein